MIKGVIFDLGGVLMHLGCQWREADQVATLALIKFLKANEVSVGDDFASVFNAARQSRWQLAEQTELEQGMETALAAALGNRRAGQLLARAVDTYFLVRERYWVSNPGALEVLRTLRVRGLRIGAVSNAEHDGLMQGSVARMGFSAYLHPVVTSAHAKWRKPNPRIFEHVAQEWKINSNEIVMVGDAPLEDIAGAHRAGMKAILIQHADRRRARPTRNPSHEASVKPDATVRTLAEIPTVIERM